ncbi:MAG TPA: diguanylate cyclase [Ferrovibrio sp.]|uniref:sensor domain-containing diguanylate cyclase n=1 Tax=Ferrovibrio sp. TaxID=1917215 RepID=UPI002B4ABA7B|nr:diguanylate cyclase [Ferrovibrio sp.]HLT75913.1 diguanylate cyclase [Ferrovibrio sp.]
MAMKQEDSGTRLLAEAYGDLSTDVLRELFFHAPTALILVDAASGCPVAASEQALALFGLAGQPAASIRMQDFWDDADERQRFLAAVRGDQVRGWRIRMRRSDDSRFWARVSARLVTINGRDAVLSAVTDVSDIVAAEEMLHRTQQTLSTLLEASPFPLIVTRLDNGVIRYCNQKAADMFETPLSGLIGHTAPEFYVNPEDRISFVERLRENGRVEGFIASLRTQGGEPFWAMLSAKTLELNGEPVFMVAFADVTRQKAKEEELATLAFRDSLTNAYNRRYFMEALQAELLRAERSGAYPAVAMIDIDHFKRLNDSRGHEAGDRVLKEFTALAQGMLRKSDVLARYGGEEFALMLPETTLADAVVIVDRIREATGAHTFSEEYRISISAGVAVARNICSAELIKAADAALYCAKREGRNRVKTAS